MVATVGIKEFDLWRPGYGGATVTVVRPGTVTPIPVYLNQDGTVRAENPQTLLTLEVDDLIYGRFKAPLYAGEDYSLVVSEGGGETITRRPLTTFDGEDAGGATLKVPNTNHARSLKSRASYHIHVLDYGDLSLSAAENSDLINTALGVAASAGGGIVQLPRAAFDIQKLNNIPSNVRLVGHGINATIMRANVAADIITLTGVRSGIEGFTLDGETLPDNSVGVRLGPRIQQNEDPPALAHCDIKDVLVRRFAKGIEASYGGAGTVITGGAVQENTVGIELDARDGQIGDLIFSELDVSLNVDAGIALHSSQDHDVKDIHIRNSWIQDGPALLDIEGAKNVIVAASSFRGGNVAGISGLENLSVRDVPDHSESFVDGLLFQACAFDNMRQRFQGRCRNLRYDNSRFEGNVWELHDPDNNILLLNCDESASDAVESSGAANLVRKDSSISHVDVNGRTTDATATTAWSYTLKPGQVIFLECVAVGRQTNGTDVASYRAARGVYLAGATLTFDNGVADFEVGELISNKTRAGEARIIAKTGDTAAGTLTISELSGDFEDGDVIGTPNPAGDIPNNATVNGELSYPEKVVLQSAADSPYSQETASGWGGLDFVENGQSVDVQVTGAAGTNIEWTVGIKVTNV